jgi:hypothetical protein
MNKHFYAIREALSRVCQGAESYLEVGVNEGTSLEVVITECPTIKSLTLVDMWGLDYGGTGRGNHNHITDLLNRLGYKGQTRFIDGNSHDILPQLIQEGVSFDLVTIDGDHSYEQTKKDIEAWWDRVAEGGYLGGHDYRDDKNYGVIQAVDEFVINHQLTLEKGENLTWFVKKWES